MARHEALLDIADVIRTYRNGQSLMHHHAARLKKHNRNKRVAVSIATSCNRTERAVLGVSCNAHYVIRRAGSRAEVGARILNRGKHNDRIVIRSWACA